MVALIFAACRTNRFTHASDSSRQASLSLKARDYYSPINVIAQNYPKKESMVLQSTQ
jgi:hypothetical protein